MAAPNSTTAKTAQAVKLIVSQLKAASAKLDADCTSTLCASDLTPAQTVLERLRKLGGSLKERKPVKLDEAMFYMRETRICEQLQSLLRRWPWAEMRQGRAILHRGLMALPDLLSPLYFFLCAAERVRSRQQAAAYAEMNERCCSKRACSHWAAVNSSGTALYLRLRSSNTPFLCADTGSCRCTR